LVGLFNTPKRKLKKLIQHGDYKEAIELGQSLEEKYATDVDYLFIMGGLYYILEDAQNTLHYLERVLEIKESDIESLFLKASVHQYLKDNKTARQCCKKILEVDPSYLKAQDFLKTLEN
jgi:tetratricopeptide (TPR) repeat protein